MQDVRPEADLLERARAEILDQDLARGDEVE
jgi:hypothetical protein